MIDLTLGKVKYIDWCWKSGTIVMDMFDGKF